MTWRLELAGTALAMGAAMLRLPTSRRLLAALSCLALTTACGDGSDGASDDLGPQRVDGGGDDDDDDDDAAGDDDDDDAISCELNLDPRPGDMDGDGLSDEAENEGWIVAVDENNDGDVDDPGESYHVQSNSQVADADGDCLTDHDEKIALTDPNDDDTDGDQLSDYEELRVYFSRPNDVDSDDDSRGNPSLFDYAEAREHGTSPTLVDTDGDGLDDFREIIDLGSSFNPRVADAPHIRIDFASAPSLTIRGTVEQTASNSWGTEISTEQAEIASTSSTDSTSTSTTMSHEAGVEVGITSEASVLPKATVSAKAHYTFTHSTTSETGYSFTQEHSSETRQAHASMEESGESITNSQYAGEMSVLVDVANGGRISFTLAGLTLNAFQRNADDPSQLDLIGALNPDTIFSDFQNVTVGPGETVQLMFANTDLDVAVVQKLMADPSSIVLKVGSYEVENAEGVSFTHQNTDIEAKTSKVIVDYGLPRDGETVLDSERFLVATNVRKDPMTGEPEGLTLAEVLGDVLAIPYTTGTVTHTEDGEVVGTSTAIESMRGIAVDKESRSYWVVSTDSESIEDPFHDFDDIVLQPEQVLHLIYVRDVDGDGLFAREEFVHGCSDELADTDGDGLSDYEEVKTGWDIVLEHPVSGEAIVYPAAPKANFTNADGDGWDDATERLHGTDPNLADTDGDGIMDDEDDFPLTILNDAPELDLEVSIAGQVAHLDGAATDADDNLVAVEIDWGDGQAQTLVDGFETIALQHDYGQDASFEITVVAIDSVGAEAEQSFDLAASAFPADEVFYDALDENPDCYIGDGYGLEVLTDRHGDLLGSCFLAQNPDEVNVLDYPELPVSTQMTVAAWVRPNYPSISVVTGHGSLPALTNHNEGIGFSVMVGGEMVTVLEEQESNNEWTFYVGVLEVEGTNSYLRLYKNGALEAETLVPNWVNPGVDCGFHIGGNDDCGVFDGEGFQGSFDDVRVFDRPLAESEIAALYAE